MSQFLRDFLPTLAIPLEKESFDEEYKAQVDSDIRSHGFLWPYQRTLQSWRKRPYSFFLTDFLNHITVTKHISVVLKESILTPIYKKGDVSDPGSYRGITVTPVLLKILEHILNNRHNQNLDRTQSKLQRTILLRAI